MVSASAVRTGGCGVPRSNGIGAGSCALPSSSKTSYLERQGLLERDTGNIYLTAKALDATEEDPSNQLLGSSITYRIAVGPQQGRKVFKLQTLPDCESDNLFSSSVGEVAGFSLHAGVATKTNEREKLMPPSQNPAGRPTHTRAQEAMSACLLIFLMSRVLSAATLSPLQRFLLPNTLN